jgi:thiamine biosynthesis lipoprotein
MAAVQERLACLEARWSVFRPGSELTALRRQAGGDPLAVSVETTGVLRLAVEVARRSGGACDPTVAPLTRLWRAATRRGRPPVASAIGSRLPLVGAAAIEFYPDNRIRLPRPGMAVELGAIGKGWAADAAGALYRAAEIRSACINLGGNVLVVGDRPDGGPWRVGVQDPSGTRGGVLGYLAVRDISVVGSGGYERRFHWQGREYHHLLDPRTGHPAVTDLAGVTIVHPSSALADALATAVFVLGCERGRCLLESYPGAEAVLVGSDGTITVTGGLRECWHPCL